MIWPELEWKHVHVSVPCIDLCMHACLQIVFPLSDFFRKLWKLRWLASHCFMNSYMLIVCNVFLLYCLTKHGNVKRDLCLFQNISREVCPFFFLSWHQFSFISLKRRCGSSLEVVRMFPSILVSDMLSAWHDVLFFEFFFFFQHAKEFA